ncbi:hypothetical protein Tco_1344165 [Tanacetum coccineum]
MERIIQIKQRIQIARDRQKSYADLKCKPIEFQVRDKVMLKVGAVAYKLELPQELSRVHNIFHVSNLKKCYSDDPLVVLLEGLQVDDKLHFVEELVGIMDREIKQLRRPLSTSVHTDDFMTPLPEGWSIRFNVWSIVLREREQDSFLVIKLSRKVVQYNLISKTLHEIYDCGSNQLDDNHDDDDDANYDDDELLQQFQAEHNVYEFIPSFASV